MQSINNNLVADTPYLDLLPEVNFNPIFIMGEHRSGTTLLYKTLTATGCFNFLKAYHIIKYDQILSNHINHTEDKALEELEELFQREGISDRAIDKVMATPDLPEEYGFILKNIVGDELRITPKNLPIFQQLCRKIQLASDPDKPMLLKNPWDLPQFMYVKSVIPKAKFIFIHRHPIHVINSKLNAARILFDSWNPYTALIAQMYAQIFNNPVKRFLYQLMYSKYFNLGLRRVTKKSVESSSYFLENVKSLPQEDYFCIRYEDLCKAPEATILNILEFLKLQPRVDLDYQSLIKPRPPKLLPEVQTNYQQICQQLQPYLSDRGYDI
ncbi:sulfotransferase family protein [Calothrix sp. CCY 0018]|uniref:sulfotransferase family protein n=1 Tax=Calothrix sp. CCY 0018 TaxID=3103864 RepID=UPI0039C6D14A